VNRAHHRAIHTGASSARARQPRQRAAAWCLAALLPWLLAATCVAATLQPFTDAAQDFSLADLKGNSHALADYRGKVVVVNFWASWCPPCVQEMPGLQRLQQRLADEPFVILAVNVGEKKYRVWKFVKLINFSLPVLLDTDKRVFGAHGAEVLPTSYLLDRQGRVRYRVQGDLEWDSDAVVSVIQQLLSEVENPE
jgi:thiol-disulfide isomerase/thioredoxin